ncbi:hypothetical protein PJ985_01090 [Streptomyces sp. ACA25]|uniref:hypothetical protein n=1 Tax=Streptomyces sp. ACA25 TaxID=3022596 RepID=UPI0023075571|nr:hypothetical protein [Streptomyces sp. ACA25]MDB1086169.1 hypothetical protein [Streptomyces sp. ACA25]
MPQEALTMCWGTARKRCAKVLQGELKTAVAATGDDREGVDVVLDGGLLAFGHPVPAP